MSLASQAMVLAARFKRSKFSVTRTKRFSSRSMAVTVKSSALSKMWQVLPPGAAQASRIFSPACGANNSAASCAASSCTLHQPSSKPGNSKTFIA